MSEREFESYLRLLSRFLKFSTEQREAVARELRGHMEERLEELLERGYTRDEATQLALDEFGDAAILANQFGRIGRRRRWIMRTTTATVTIAATILLVSFLMPERRALVPAPPFSMAAEQARKPAGDAPAPAVQPARRQTREITPGESEADKRVLEQMKIVLPTVDFAEGTGFAELVEWLRVQTKLSIDVNWPALALGNMERNTDTGGMSLRDVKAETVLEILLDKVSAAAGGVAALDWQVTDGVVRISTADQLKARTVVRVYDCQDLLRQAASPSTMPVDPQTSAAARAEDMENLIELIKNTVEPGSWAPDGTVGSISEYDGLLVVLHNWRAQHQIAGLLNDMRQAKAARNVEGAGAATRPAADRGAARRDQTVSRIYDVRDFAEGNSSQQALARLIRDQIEPGTWTPDGSTGTIDFWNDRLVVRHDETAHRRLLNMLDAIREIRGPSR